MAIAPAVPGLDVTVEVNNVALPEYQYENEDAYQYGDKEAISAGHEDSACSVTKYLEVPSGAEFSVRWVLKEPFDNTLPTHAQVMLDGSYLNVPFQETGDKDDARGYKYMKTVSEENGQVFTQTFRFSELEIDDQPHPTEGLKRQLEGIGTITIYMYFVIGEQQIYNPNVPRLELSQLDPMNEKVNQKCAPVRGDVLTHQASLSEPQAMLGSAFHEVQTEKEPFACYTSHYRSTRALKSLGIIPRTPSPSRSPTVEPEEPANPPDLNSMTTEQLIAELSQRREREEKTVRVKREHDEAFGQDGVDYDDVLWTGTRPVRMRAFGELIG
ncbi:hypothetical protein E8E12_003396 [Didymella heteroderae]|uniref:DUF7918 domain-containing protein n=1 Tax=Didymella heteroderae TaxID=1769908 RepID=A0A9P5BZ21_9PLEO|nr:hypothetical protein E8E12_003396 [Didymella heteroderae]